MVFKFVVSDPKTAKTYQKDIEKSKVSAVVGLKIGNEFDGGILGLPGYKLQITGGSDKGGFPLKRGVSGAAKKRILLANKPCYKPLGKGIRRRKMVRGSTISEDLVQINTKVIKEGKQALNKIFSSKEAEAPAEEKPEAPAEKPKEEKKEEPKKEEKTEEVKNLADTKK